MNTNHAAAGFPDDEIVRLVTKLRETHERLQELAGGEADAVIHPNGDFYLLHEAQEKLRRSEAAQFASAKMQSAILNALPANIALIDHEGVIVSVNEGWLRFATSNALESSACGIGQNYLERCEAAGGPSSAEARQAAAGIRAVLAGTIPHFNMEYPCHAPSEQCWFRLMATPIGNRGLRGAVVMHVDITIRKLSEDAVRESEERFHGLYSAAATGIAVSDPQGNYLQANAAYCEMLGYTEEELRTMNIGSVIHPADLAQNMRNRGDLLAGKLDRFMMEKRYLRKGGGILWTRASVSATRAAGGKAKSLIVVAEDITEQKMAAEEVRRSTALLSMASRLGRMGAWVLEYPSMALTWSAGMRGIHEVPPDYVPSLADDLEFYLPEYRDTVRAAVERCGETGTPFDLEAQILTAKGRRVWVRAIGERVRSGSGVGGVSTRLQGAFQDISDRKEREEEMARINRALKLLSNCNEALIRAEVEKDLLAEVCKVAVESGGYRMAWAGYAADDESMVITPQAHAGAGEGGLCGIKVTWNENEPSGMGLAARVIRSGKAEVCADITKDPSFSHWSGLALEEGCRSGIALPLRDATRTFGLLALVAADEKPTSAEELKLLQDLAGDLAFGILNLRSRAEKRGMENAVLKIAAGVSVVSGTEFFQQLARNMAEALGAQGAFVAQLLDREPLTNRFIAGFVDGRSVEPREQPVKGTPSEILLMSDTCVMSKLDTDQYPNATILRSIGALGYVGQRLNGSTGRHLGHLSVYFRGPVKNPDFITSTLQIFAARAASEIERHQTDAQLRDQARLLDIAHDAIRVDNLDSCIIYWNKGAQRIYGWEAEEALGRLSDEMLHHDPADSLKAVKMLLAHGEWKGEARKRTKDGRNIIVEVHWTLVRDARGRPKSILAIEADITDRKRLEEQFLRVQRMESIGTLASGLAHDLNNVLAPIVMCAPILRGDLPLEDKEKIVAAIESSASRGAKIISQVLTFGRGAQGERQPMQIAPIIREIKQVADETFPKNIRIDCVIAAGLCEIIGDATQWHQVLMNLCVNARDAMPDGGALRITAENLVVDAQYASMVAGLSAGPHLVIEVSDTGSGIPPEVAERIFDPFFTTKPVGKGTGLGLSTVLGIVKSHGGVINLATRPGVGTTFRILVPSMGESELAATGDAAAAPEAGNGQTVLIADDEEYVREAARTVLEMHGYRVLVAADGIEALALFADHSGAIKALITDITMPFMDGVALIQSLQRLRPGLPMIASTGQDESARDLRSLELATILRKPYKSDALLGAVAAALKAPREERPS
jgi:PAS domain S-box-containing protein